MSQDSASSCRCHALEEQLKNLQSDAEALADKVISLRRDLAQTQAAFHDDMVILHLDVERLATALAQLTQPVASLQLREDPGRPSG